MVSKVIIPDLGATEDNVVLNEWLVKPGDFVKAGTPLFLVTTDKAIVEVEAFRDGYIREVLVPEETTVPAGEAVAIMADSMEEPMVDVSPQGPVEITELTAEQCRVEAKTERLLASPLARRIARELGIDLSSLKGTGEGGLIHKRDVLAAARTQ